MVHEASENEVLKFSGGTNAIGFTVRYPFTTRGETEVNLAGQGPRGAQDVLTDEFVHEAGYFGPEVGKKTDVPNGCATHGSDVEATCVGVRDRIANEMKQAPPNSSQ